MKKPFILISLLITVFFVNACLVRSGFAGECDDFEGQDKIDCEENARQIKQAQEKLDAETKEGARVKAEIGTVGEQLNYTVGVLNETEAQLEEKKSQILSLEEQRKNNNELKSLKEAKRAELVRYIYKRGQANVLSIFLSSDGFSKAIQLWGQQQIFLKKKVNELAGLTREVLALNAVLGVETEKKEVLTGEVSGLSQKKNALVIEKSNLEVTHSKIQDEIARVASELAGITARQQQLLAEKLGSFSTSVGDVPPPDDNPPPHFAGKAYALFSFGAPHRVGMSQFGALGRAKAGQNYRDILNAYYNNVRIEKRDDLTSTIEVYGYGRINFEDNYLYGIAEMPTNWADQGGFEALKSQAVAARSYAIAATGNGGNGICAGEGCQVYNSGKAAGGADAWYRAVNETRGEVMLSNDTGQVISAWYSSTTGGYTLSSASVWGRPTPYAQGIKDVIPGGAWPTDAYEGTNGGRSPWFYKAWYHSRNQAASRPSAWLNEEEFADILNAVWLYTVDNGTVSHLSQVDKGGGDTWSHEQVRTELTNRGYSPITSISDITDTTFSDGGFTLSVNAVTDQEIKSFSGGDFRAIFNIRAPGELIITSSLFSVEER